jgi:hypothetical protein
VQVWIVLRIGFEMLRIFVAAALCLTFLGTQVRAQTFLGGEALTRELGGFTIKGYYLGDKVNFVEVYKPDGSIAYKDDIKGDVGKWFVRGRAFCTFYDRIGGACWYVVKISGNCFEFYQAPNDGPDISFAELTRRPPHARAARDSDKVTCEAWLGS